MISGKSLWLPRDDEQTLLWLDGNDPNATGLTPSNTSVVTTWKDKSKNGFDFTQTTGANKPTNLNSSQNGNNVIKFVATQFLDSSAFDLTSSYSFIAVISFTSVGSGYALTTTTGATPEVFFNVNSGVVKAGTWSGSADKGVVTSSITINTFYVFSYVYDSAGNGQLWKNGVSQGTAATAAFSSAGSLARRIGAHAGGTQPLGANYGEFILGSGVWTDVKRNRMEVYARSKWNI